MTTQRVRLKRFLSLARITDGQWCLRDGEHGQWVIDGPPWLGRLLRPLLHEQTVDGLVEELAGAASRQEVRAAIDDLLDEQVAEYVADDEPAIAPHVNDLAIYLSRWDIGPKRIEQVVRTCRVGVFGSGAMADEVSAALRQGGLSAERVADLDQLDTPPALLVIPCGAADDRGLEKLNRFAIGRDVPWLRLALDAHVVQLGPLFVPGKTACWECFRRRIESHRRADGLHDVRGPAGTADDAQRDAAVPAFVRQLAANLAVLEVLRFLFAHEPNRCIGKLLCVDLRDFAVHGEVALRIPDCPSCSTRSGRASLAPATSGGDPGPVGASPVRRWRDLLVGGRCGVIQGAAEVPVGVDDPRVYVVAAEPADMVALGGLGIAGAGGGVGLTPDDAWAAAIAEAAERYCASFGHQLCGTGFQPVDPPVGNRCHMPVLSDALQHCAYAELDPDQAVDPHTMALFGDQQYGQPGFPCRRFTRDTCVTWVAGQRLTGAVGAGDRTCWLPAECVFLGRRAVEQEKSITLATSTGLATGETLPRAVLAGLCEVIERDAFVIAWRNRLSAPRLDLRARPVQWLRELLESRFGWPRIEYHVADLTSDVQVPTYAVISRGPSRDGPIISFGAACHPHARTALVKALLEAAMGRVYVRRLVRVQPRRMYRRDFSDVRTFADHAQFYTRHPRRWRHLRRLVSGRQHAALDVFDRQPPGEVDAMNGVVRQLERLGLTAWCCELTTSDVAQACLHVVRVLVPQMQPLHGDYRLPFLGGERQHHPERVFHWAHGRRRSTNRFPHPYP